MGERKYKYISFLVPPELETALRAAAVREDRSVAWIIKKALAKYLNISGATVLKDGRKSGSR